MIARLHATAAAIVIFCMFVVSAVIIQRTPVVRPLVIVPIMSALVWIVFAVTPFLAPRGRNLLRAESAYGTIWLAVTSLNAVLFGVVAARALGAHPGQSILIGAMGVFLIVAGNICGKLPPNHLAGVRTPWALADDEIWDKTQRLGGWCLVIAGFITINAALLLQPKPAWHLMVGSLITTAAIASAASWNWARLKRRETSEK